MVWWGLITADSYPPLSSHLLVVVFLYQWRQKGSVLQWFFYVALVGLCFSFFLSFHCVWDGYAN